MINRVLIRIKVVQMLYSYLLTQGEFKLSQLPENATRDKKCAHSVYIDMLLMIERLSGIKINGDRRAIAGVDDNRYLATNRVGRMLRADSDLGAATIKSEFNSRYSAGLIERLYSEITKSAAYRSYIRLKNRQLGDDVRFWTAIVNTVFAKSAELQAELREADIYTAASFEQALEMVTASVEALGDVSVSYTNARNSLERSLDKAYELYHALLALPVELTRVEEQRLDAARHKFLPTHNDLNPDMRFVDNRLVKALSVDKDLNDFLADHPFSWNDDPQLVRSLLEKVTSSEIYRNYMEAETDDFKTDCDFWRSVFKNIILPSDDLAEALESMSVYWNDDLDIVGTFVVKTMRRFADEQGNAHVLLPKYKDDEDAAFGGELFVDTVDHIDEYRELIDKFIDRSQWDTERLAFMDVVIMCVAISELLNYPAIPIAVTLNEYIEMANSYSTPKSGQFINGILYSVINYLKNEGRLNKN